MTFFDSNILIYFIENDQEFGLQAAQALTAAIESGRATFSVLAITELTSHKQTEGQRKKLVQLEQLVEFYDFTKDIAKKAGELRSNHTGLRTPDAIHLATAIEFGANKLLTNDKNLAKIASSYIPTKTIG